MLIRCVNWPLQVQYPCIKIHRRPYNFPISMNSNKERKWWSVLKPDYVHRVPEWPATDKVSAMRTAWRFMPCQQPRWNWIGFFCNRSFRAELLTKKLQNKIDHEPIYQLTTTIGLDSESCTRPSVCLICADYNFLYL